MHWTDRHLSSSFARNSTKAAWTSSRGGAGRLEPVVVLGGLGGLGVGRCTGVVTDPCGVCEVSGARFGMFCRGVV